MSKKTGPAPSSESELYLLAARRFEALFDGVPVACFTFDNEGTVFEWNSAAEEVWERAPSAAFQTELSKAARMGDNLDAVERLLSEVRAGEPVRNLEWCISFEDGRNKWLAVNAFPLRDAQGTVNGGVLSALDITGRMEMQHQLEAHILRNNEIQLMLEMQRDELATMNAKLEALATTDGLTGLKNHRSFQEFLDQQCQIVRRSKDPLSLLLLDVDKFKSFNDTHGHPAGDEVLRCVARVLSEKARASDFVARYGGEEFVVVLTATDAQGALDAAERFRMAIESAEVANGPVTASFGCATFRGKADSREKLIARADAALYESKHAGRNCSTHTDSLARAA